MTVAGVLCLLPWMLAADAADPADAPDARAAALAEQVMKASGADNWHKVRRIRFTFNVEQDGKTVVSAQHDWDVRANTDTVTWDGKTVKVDLAADNAEGDAKAAFARWTNDSYWLLMPLKLKDGGVRLRYEGREEINGQAYEVLRMSFEEVGLTPGDQYNLYIDPQTHLVRRWDYMPTPEKKVSGTWDDYKTIGGLTLSTDHQFGPRRIFFTDIEVETD